MNHPFLQDLCAALVLSFGHFLWIGTLIAVVAAVVARRQATAANRYGVWLSGLIAMAASPFVTLVVLMAMPSVDAVPASTSAALVGEPVDATTHGDAADEARRMDALVRPLRDGDHVDDGKQHRDVSEDGRTRASILQGGRSANGSDEQRPTATDTSQRESAWWRDYAPLVTSLYLIGVALMGLRLAFGLWGGRRLRNQATLITERSLLDALQRQADALGMKLVPALAYCERVTVPTVLGILKPMVLLPVSVASGLAPDQIESVLAHELAHLRRCDHLVNLMQCVIESVLFFHPAVWWVSRRIRDEREHCCDDLVIACGAVPLDYAASLLRVAELSREAEQQRGRVHRRSFTAASLFATGDRPSTLRQRIARLLDDSSTPVLRLSPRVVLVMVCLPIMGLLAVMQIGAHHQPSPKDGNNSAEIELPSDVATPNDVKVTVESQLKREEWLAFAGGDDAANSMPEIDRLIDEVLTAGWDTTPNNPGIRRRLLATNAVARLKQIGRTARTRLRERAVAEQEIERAMLLEWVLKVHAEKQPPDPVEWRVNDLETTEILHAKNVGRIRELVDFNRSGWRAEWSPDGRFLAFLPNIFGVVTGVTSDPEAQLPFPLTTKQLDLRTLEPRAVKAPDAFPAVCHFAFCPTKPNLMAHHEQNVVVIEDSELKDPLTAQPRQVRVVTSGADSNQPNMVFSRMALSWP